MDISTYGPMKTGIAKPLSIVPIHIIFPQSVISSGPKKLRELKICNCIKCIIPQSVVLPHQLFRILGPGLQHSQNDHF